MCTGHEKYEKVRDLSSGAFGFVQLARNRRNGHLVAIKFLERGRDKVSTLFTDSYCMGLGLIILS